MVEKDRAPVVGKDRAPVVGKDRSVATPPAKRYPYPIVLTDAYRARLHRRPGWESFTDEQLYVRIPYLVPTSWGRNPDQKELWKKYRSWYDDNCKKSSEGLPDVVAPNPSSS